MFRACWRAHRVEVGAPVEGLSSFAVAVVERRIFTFSSEGFFVLDLTGDKPAWREIPISGEVTKVEGCTLTALTGDVLFLFGAGNAHLFHLGNYTSKVPAVKV